MVLLLELLNRLMLVEHLLITTDCSHLARDMKVSKVSFQELIFFFFFFLNVFTHMGIFKYK